SIEHAGDELSVAGGCRDLLGKLLPGGVANLAVDSHVSDDLDAAVGWGHEDQDAGARFGQMHPMRQDLLVRLPAGALGRNGIRYDVMLDRWMGHDQSRADKDDRLENEDRGR